MDWLLRPATAEAAGQLRAEISNLVRRHAAEPEEAWEAEIAIGELVGNAVEHAGGPIWVSLDWSAPRPVLTVHDLGPTFEPTGSLPDETAERGRGLWLVSAIVGDLTVAAKRGGGKRVRATLPVVRRAERSFDPPRQRVNPLPGLDEAGSSGFGIQPFLRALVVELARAEEEIHGPVAAERIVSQVGATIGGQMEAEYRGAREIVGRLTPAQLADCYLRLKAAIHGDFYVIEVSEDRIVLGNRRCPFGEAVRRSPALCRMTSSVFGGIAARNNGGAIVLLDERIAVGDPECRVTVLLGPPTIDAGHHYHAAVPADADLAVGADDGPDDRIIRPGTPR